MPNGTAFAFFSYESEAPTSDQLRRAYDYFDAKFRRLGAQPTYFGAGGYLKLKKYGGALHKRTLEDNFAPTKDGSLGFSIYCNPAGSDAPAYDYLALANYSYLPSESEAVLTFYAEDRYIDAPSSALEQLLGEVAALETWNFGQALSWPVEREPYMHLIGGMRRDGSEESRRQDKWYAAQAPERLVKVRDVYPYNMLNAQQLAQPLPGSATLRDFIARDPDSALKPLAPGLELWTVEPEETERVRAALAGTGILIAE